MKLGENLSPQEMEKVFEEQTKVQDKIDAGNLWELDRELDIAMDAIRVPPGDVARRNAVGGRKAARGLCQLLLKRPDILLLDEPTNHLDAESVSWLEGFYTTLPAPWSQLRTTATSSTTSPAGSWNSTGAAGYPYEGNYSRLAGNRSRRALAIEEKTGIEADRRR